MSSAEEARLVEILLTHNEAVSCEDLACALGMQREGVRALALSLQAQGFAVIGNDSDMVTATPAADAALRTGPE
jgi:biotin operon repressor